MSRDRRLPGRWAVPLAAIAAPAIVIVVAVGAGSAPYSVFGLGDPGTLVRVIAPLLRLIAEACAVMCVGALTFAAFFAPDESSRLSPVGYAAVVSAGRWAIGWAVTAAALVPVETADLSGVPLSGPPLRAPLPDQLALWANLEQPMAWLVTAVLAIVVAITCRWVLRWQPTVAVWAVSIVAVLPQAVTGHGASDAGHGLAEAALLIHVPVAVAWIGVLIALLRPTWRRGVPAAVSTAEARILMAHAHIVRETVDDLTPTGLWAVRDALVELTNGMMRQEFDDVEPRLAPALARAAMEIVDRCLTDSDLTPRALARELNVSVRTLNRAFASAGEAVTAYIRRRRLEQARRDLLEPALRRPGVSEVAARYQFADGSHFARAFRAQYGQAPAEFTRLPREETDDLLADSRRPASPTETPGTRA